MASALNLLDIAKLNGADKVAGLIEEVLTLAPEVANFPARTIRGTSYKTVVRSALPSVEFRLANQGVANSKSTFINKTVETYIVDAQIRADKAVADSYEDGAAAYQAIEASGVMASTLKLLGTQIWYGVGSLGDSDGFPGALASHDSSMVVDAGGTTDNVSTSVWGVKYGPQYATLVLGNGGSMSMSDFVAQQVTDSTNLYTAYCAALTAYPGLQIGNKYCLGRIKKITTDSTKTLSDAFIAQLLEKFMANLGMFPDALYMTPRSLRQLQSSRTATTPDGKPAPFPVEAFGVPIVVTNQILNTETLAL